MKTMLMDSLTYAHILIDYKNGKPWDMSICGIYENFNVGKILDMNLIISNYSLKNNEVYILPESQVMDSICKTRNINIIEKENTLQVGQIIFDTKSVAKIIIK